MTSATRLMLVADTPLPSNGDLIQKHLRMLKRRNASQNTIDAREGALKRLQNWLDSSLLLVTLTVLEDWQDSLKVSVSSIATYTIHVRSFYRWAEEQGLVTTDPARHMVVPKVPRRLSRPITEADLRDALTASKFDPQLHCMLLLAAFCGLRAAEVAACRVEDFRPGESNGGAFLVVHGKGDKDRVVRVPPKVLAEIEALGRKAGPVFPNALGGHLRPNRVTQVASHFFQGIGLSYTLHKLRHRFANALADLGADVRDIQSSLGHESLQTTTLYLAANSRRGAASIDQLSETLGGA
ncbi:tyrosine-type recombinase/integrase [Rhodococcus sp. H36-A4]|uniref:tyrosine-type recombinase/integrase n=1 Tax=Rhodococcus sp. H36-A4 TaxID=3004353 RepID=UPI0022AFAAB3|nr:tyrosine-type recombinase/integrase [Rhodococcus sp. H36-A4]MCZ4077285.1 tyrosine-type recombinase/integrase [Rhodococcus sp. H36-A4]